MKGKIIILFEAMLLIAVIVMIIIVVNSDDFIAEEQPSLYITTQSQTENVPDEEYTFSSHNKNDEQAVVGNDNLLKPDYNSGSIINGETVVVNQQSGTSSELPDPSGWSKAKIVSTAKDAVNKTKAYTGSLVVTHSENFTANVTECSGGGIVKSVVDLMIGWVVSPVSETLSYQNGRATNSEGESVPIILPIKNAFTLSENGVSNASVKREGNEYVITLKLVEEKVGMYQVPTHNAASIGYLDVANFDISFMEVDKANIIYKGSSIVLRVNADGYVTYASYEIPLHIDGAAHKGSISGTATFEGSQTEEWILNW